MDGIQIKLYHGSGTGGLPTLEPRLLPKNSEGPASEEKWGLARPQGEGGLTPTKPENAASALFDRWQAYCPLSTEGNLYLTANAVVASFYMVKAVEPPYYWAPYGFDAEGIPVYHELYPDALHAVYAGKRGYLYRVEAAEEQIAPLQGIPGAYTAAVPFPVAGCEELPDVYEWLLRAEAEKLLCVGRFDEKTQEELSRWYEQIGAEARSLHLPQNPDCSYARFLRENIPQAWGKSGA